MATPTGRSSSPAPHGGGGASSETPINHQQHDPTTVVIDNGALGSSSAAVAAAAAAAAAAGSSRTGTHSVSTSHRQPIHLQQMVKSLQTALQKKNEECAFWRDLYTNLVSQKSAEGNILVENNDHQRSPSSAANHNGQKNNIPQQGQHQHTQNGQDQNKNTARKDPKRALEEATGYFAVEMANKKLKTEQQATSMKEKLGKVLEQLSRQQQLVKEKDQQIVLIQKQYEMDVARRDHELQICKLEKDHAVQLSSLQVKLQYLEAGPVGAMSDLPPGQQSSNKNFSALTAAASFSSTTSGAHRSGFSDIQASKFAQMQYNLRTEIATVRQDLEAKLARLSELQDSKVTGLKHDHEAKIARLKTDLETKILAVSAAAAGSNPHTAAIAAAATSCGGGRSGEGPIIIRRTNNVSSSVTPEKPSQRQIFDCLGDCDNSKLFTANCPLLKAGGIYKWSMRIKNRNGSPRLGVISTACTQLDSGKWLGEAGIGWGYSDWGQTWYEGRHIKTDLPRFDEGDKVTLTLDLTGSGTLSASVNDDANHLLFFDMMAKLSSSSPSATNGDGFYPAATLLNSRVEFTDFEAY